MNPDPDRSDDFELRLRRGGRLVPELESDVDGPDPEFDRLVLARAREAIAAPRPRDAAPRFDHSPRWAVPVALAATLVLSFALVLQMDGRDAVAPPAAERALAPSTAPAPVASTATPVVDGAAAATAESTSESVDGGAAAGAPAGPTTDARQAMPRAATAARQAPAMPAALPPAAAPAPAVLAAPAATARAAAESSAVTGQSAQEWLARIERLQADGDLDAARRELAAFREQHPHVAVPESLRTLADR